MDARGDPGSSGRTRVKGEPGHDDFSAGDWVHRAWVGSAAPPRLCRPSLRTASVGGLLGRCGGRRCCLRSASGSISALIASLSPALLRCPDEYAHGIEDLHAAGQRFLPSTSASASPGSTTSLRGHLADRARGSDLRQHPQIPSAGVKWPHVLLIIGAVIAAIGRGCSSGPGIRVGSQALVTIGVISLSSRTSSTISIEEDLDQRRPSAFKPLGFGRC